MQYGLTFPDVDARTLAELAHEAEEAGWDGVFVWDLIYGIDAWVSLAAVATRTERVRFGTMLTPLSRRRPWKVASEVVTLDHLSNGRMILPVGLGAAGPEHKNSGFPKVGEEVDRKTRAELLDESLDILDGLWSGQPFSYDGKHYHINDVTFSPTPVQSPRVPIWVVGAWPRMKSMLRVLRCDGILPVKMNADRSFADLTPADIQAIKAFVAEHRTLTTPFDIVIEDETPGDDPARAAAIVQPWAEAGATWWLEAVWKTPESQGGVEGMRARVKQGPPRIGA
ncbi:MAG TPA: LLM class flavin-dependent oxidoreductase [Ktedonobacterales bacterium]|jgi:alkanesulfonate monooxygenase SsuD/methylene tetrahydromethanopterin reductase-like flavin-dependent oxidoreductase (luciferase family)